MKKADMDRLQRAEMSMMRWMCGSRQAARVSSTALRSKLGGIAPISACVRRRRLAWLGHVERSKDDGWLKRACNLEVKGNVSAGRPKTTWETVVNGDLKHLGIDKSLAHNRAWWRVAISL